MILHVTGDLFTHGRQLKQLKGDKLERLIAQIDLFEGGSVLLPKEAPWLEGFVSELLSFPGRHDDQVDALSQGLAWRRETWKQPLQQRRYTLG